jgi:enoyl-CoA hydratase/carnithine racemase
MATGTVELAVSGRVATLTITNPPLNVITAEMRAALLEHCLHLGGRSDISVVVVEGAGDRAFSAGSDIKQFPKDAFSGVGKVRVEQHVLDRLMHLPQVTIAKLHGHVLGGGAAIMLACDLRVAAQDTRIGLPEIKVGVFPAGGATHFVARQIPIAKAKEMILLGETLSAQEALAAGLINRLVERAELEAATNGLASRLCALPGNALAAAKKAINTAYTGTFEQGQTTEIEEFAKLFGHPNMNEGMAAFFEKRPAKFT